MSNCRNCKSDLRQEDEFCRLCGQSILDLRQSIWKVLGQVMHELFDTDGRAIKTVKTLFSSPGKLSVDFADGQRVKYAPPLRLYLIVSVVFFVFMEFIEARMGDRDGNSQKIVESISQNMFYLLPGFALLLQLLNRKTYFVFNFVFTLHLHIFAFVVLLPIIPLSHMSSNDTFLKWLLAGLLGYMYVYIFLALKRFYKNSWLKTTIKFLLLFMVYSATFRILMESARVS